MVHTVHVDSLGRRHDNEEACEKNRYLDGPSSTAAGKYRSESVGDLLEHVEGKDKLRTWQMQARA